MPNYDDPNLDSQNAPPDQATPEAQATNALTSGTINDFIRKRPAVQIWLSGHNGGRNLSDNEKQQFFTLLEKQGIDPTHLEFDDDTGTISWPKHVVRDIALGSLMAFGPVVASWAIPLAAGAGGGSTVPTAASTLGPSTPANIAATTAAVNGAAPAALSTGLGPVATYGATSITSDLLRYGVPTAGSIISGIVQSKAASAASDAQQKYLEEALAYEKEKDAGNISREASRYADFQGNISPYLQRGNSAGDRMSALLGLPAGAAPSIQPRGGAPEGNPLDFADKLGPDDRAKVDALLKKYNVSDDPRYWYGVNAMHGGFDQTGADWNERRISVADGAGKGYRGAAAPAGNQYGTQPVARAPEQPAAAMVTVQAPDGTQRTVSQAQADFYVKKGATIVGAAA